MRLIGDLLGEVLANTAKLVAERKSLIREGSCAHGHGDREDGRSDARLERVAGDKGGQGFKSPANVFTPDDTQPAQRVCGPKSATGGKR
jgi:hypothetical protein